MVLRPSISHEKVLNYNNKVSVAMATGHMVSQRVLRFTILFLVSLEQKMALAVASGGAKPGGLLASASRDAEYLTSFTRVDVGQDSDEEKVEEGKPIKKKSKDEKRRRRGKGKEAKEKEEKEAKPVVDPAKPPSPRIPASKSTFAQITKELKARKVAQLQAALKARKNKKKGRREEEIYTDKDRAAAVNMGTKDIKQSLKMKKRQDRNQALQIPEEAEPSTLLALGNNELRSGDVKIALNFVNKALELNPGDKNGLVARSKCYLLLGEPQLALQDAETALHSDKAFIRAIYQKAEALYHLGDFEHSLMYYHRGHRLRPELEIFRLGVQKAQEAIENTIGSIPKNATANQEQPNSPSKPKPETTLEKPVDTNRSDKSSGGSEKGLTNRRRMSCAGNTDRRRSKSAAPTARRGSRNLLGELGTDRIYFENLLRHPDILCSNQEATSVIIAQAEEGIAFLKSRQEFWRQQRPDPVKPKPRRRRNRPPSSVIQAAHRAEAVAS